MTLLLPMARTYTQECLDCGLIVSAASERGLMDAMQAHADHVNDHADHDTDPHFEDARLDDLMVP